MSNLNLILKYQKKNKNIKFLNLVISDTFGLGDKRKKLVNLLKTNYKRNLVTKIISKNLYINLLNVKDIISAIKLILKIMRDSIGNKDLKLNLFNWNSKVWCVSSMFICN